MTNSKRFPADEAIHHTGQRGPMVVLASDHDAETERLQRHLDSRNEQIDGYERQFGIDKAGAEHTIGSEIERLTRERDVSRAAIEQLHAAVKTAQELAATRLMEIGRLSKREKNLMDVIDSRDRALGFVPLDEVHASEPCEQRGPFAGLQSLSFDVSENPTIALVMRFDNIEHAQAARDQLWQPAGAARDASPADLVGALQDVVHTDPGPVRAGKAVKSPNPIICERCGLNIAGLMVHECDGIL